MVAKIIRDYVSAGDGRRLTLPGFGTFIRKAGRAEVTFNDSLRTDDGRLGELVEDYGHYSPVEAMALVDRFVFETKNAIEHTGSAVFEDFGTISLDLRGHYRFTHASKARPSKETAVQRKLFGFEWTSRR